MLNRRDDGDHTVMRLAVIRDHYIGNQRPKAFLQLCTYCKPQSPNNVQPHIKREENKSESWVVEESKGQRQLETKAREKQKASWCW